MYNPVDIDLMRLEHDRRREELTRPTAVRRVRWLPALLPRRRR